jgi:hypothetical protein
MHLPDPSTFDNWSDEIAEEAVGEFNATIRIYDDQKSVVVDNRSARIVITERPMQILGTDQWNVMRRARFQIVNNPADPIFQKAWTIRVLNGGEDATLERYAFTIMTNVSDSHAAVRTLECISEFAPLNPVS